MQGLERLEVSALGLGRIGISMFYGGRHDAEFIATIQRAIDLAIDLLHTADMYGRGDKERKIAALRIALSDAEGARLHAAFPPNVALGHRYGPATRSSSTDDGDGSIRARSAGGAVNRCAAPPARSWP